MSPAVQIKICTEQDLVLLAPHGEAGYFAEAFFEQMDGKRLIFIALSEGVLAGYVHLNRNPQYVPFRRLSIPEIQDLYVLPAYRRAGIGEKLVAACEEQAKSDGASDIGIGVGVAGTFGTAQRLYVRLGYVPDGAGVVFDRESVVEGSMKPIDDRLCLMLMKSL